MLHGVRGGGFLAPPPPPKLRLGTGEKTLEAGKSAAMSPGDVREVPVGSHRGKALNHVTHPLSGTNRVFFKPAS